MVFKSQDLVNLHSFYPYLAQSVNQLPILKSSSFISEFERYCISGDIESLDSYLQQHNLVRNEQQLIKGLLLSIEQNQLPIFRYLLQVPIYSSIVQRHLIPIRNFILKFGQISFLSTLENSFVRRHQHPINSLCQQSLDIAIAELLSYYQTSLNSLSLEQHYQNMLETLANIYQKNKTKEFYNQFELPLTYESFLVAKTQYDELQLKVAYQKHRLHTTWRLLHPQERWFDDEYENKLSQLLKQNLWLLVLMWLTASDKNLNFTHLFPISVEERIEMFFERLSFICDNQHQTKKHIFQSVIAHPYNQLLTEEIVIFEHERFLHLHMLNQFKNLSLQELQHLIGLIKGNNLINHPQYLTKLALNENDYQSFYQKMSSKWGSQWENNTNLVQISKEVLSDSYLILQTHQRTLIDSIKQLCQQYHSQPGFGFFSTSQIKAITSIKPTTADERVPLSYGVPDSPKS